MSTHTYQFWLISLNILQNDVNFLRSTYRFTVLVSSFSKSDCLDFIANDEWPQFTWPQFTGLSGLGTMLES